MNQIIDGNTIWEDGHVWEGHISPEIVSAFRPELKHIAKGDVIWGDLAFVKYGEDPFQILMDEDNRAKWMEPSREGLRMPTGKLGFYNYGTLDEEGNFTVVEVATPPEEPPVEPEAE